MVVVVVGGLEAWPAWLISYIHWRAFCAPAFHRTLLYIIILCPLETQTVLKPWKQGIRKVGDILEFSFSLIPHNTFVKIDVQSNSQIYSQPIHCTSVSAICLIAFLFQADFFLLKGSWHMLICLSGYLSAYPLPTVLPFSSHLSLWLGGRLWSQSAWVWILALLFTYLLFSLCLSLPS